MGRAVGCAALLAGLALVGCGERPARSTAPIPSVSAFPAPSYSRTPQASAASPDPAGQTVSARPSADAVLVEFGRQGGFAGLSDRLVIWEDGRYALVRTRPALSRSGRLTAAELADLRGALERSGFKDLPGAEPGQGNDLYTYHVTYGNWQIVAQDGGVAEPLEPVIAALAAVIQEYGS